MNKFIVFGVMSAAAAFVVYKAIDFCCGHIANACSGNIYPAQICCTICMWILSMMFFYALEDEFKIRIKQEGEDEKTV